MTPRQELIKQSAIRLRLWWGEKVAFILPGGDLKLPSAHHAIEAITDECRTCKPGTLGAAMLAYYRGVNERGLVRLIYAVLREAHIRPEVYKAEITIGANYSRNWMNMWHRKEREHDNGL